MKNLSAIFIVLLQVISISLTGKAFAQTQWIKDPANPVLGLGASGTWDDEGISSGPVIFDGRIFKMWYTGYDGTNGRIGYATSSEGTSWTKHSIPVLDIGSSGSWEERYVLEPAVFFDGTTYHMWYTGTPANNVHQIGYATSPDGINWTKHASNPVVAPGISGWDSQFILAPSVVFDGTTYHMWYTGRGSTGYDQIGYATSPDGINWAGASSSPVVDKGPSGSFDAGNVERSFVLLEDGIFKMWYGGQAPEPQIGYATSTDGINWTKFSTDPVLPFGPSGAWDDDGLNGPEVVRVGDTYHMWYSGDNQVVGLVGYAVSQKATFVSGSQSGTWGVAGSPYIVVGDITVPSDSLLTIETGVKVKFDQGYKMIVYGELRAEGNATDSIYFTSNATNPQGGDWLGIRFEPGSSDSSRLKYAVVEYGDSESHSDRVYAGIVNCNTVSPTISNCVFRFNNHNDVHVYNANAIVERNAFFEGAVSFFDGATGECNYNLFVGDGSSLAIYVDRNANTTGHNNTIYNYNQGIVVAGLSGGAPANYTGYNEIVWNAATPIFVETGSSANITYSCIQSGYTGIGNIDSYPEFTDTTANDFTLKPISPSIDTGDPSFTDPDGTRSDMGAFYYNQSFVTWQLQLTASTAGITDTENFAGVASAATDTFDSDFDIPEPNPAPSNYLSLYFPHPEWNHLLGDNFTKDIRFDLDLSDSITVWDFEVDTDQSDSTVILTITPQDVPQGFNILLRDLDAGVSQDIRVDSEYAYVAASIGHFQLLVGDSTAPSVTVTYPNGDEILLRGETETLTWTGTDGTGIESFELLYSTDGGNSYTPIDTVGGDVFSYDWIVPDALTFEGLIKVVGVDTMGNDGEDVSDDVFIIAPDSMQQDFFAGWSLFSLPLDSDNPLTVASILGDDINCVYFVFRYEQGYGFRFLQDADTLYNDEGYWIGMVCDNTIDIQGTAVTDTFFMAIDKGWNMIGSPLFLDYPKDHLKVRQNGGSMVSLAQAATLGWVSPALYRWVAPDTDYSMPDTMRPWEGYWFAGLEDGLELVVLPESLIGNPKQKTKSKKQEPAIEDWLVNLQVTFGKTSDNLTGFGAKVDATNDFDAQYDYPEPPRAPGGEGEYVQVYFPRDDWIFSDILGEKYNRDIKKPLPNNERQSWTFKVETSQSGQVTISWIDILDQLPQETHQKSRFTLTDMDNGKTLNMLTEHNYTYFSEGMRTFVVNGIIVNVDEEKDIIPTTFNLSQNYPNPFNPSTTIRYGIPRSVHVKLSLYDITGRKVMTLVDKQQMTGWYDVKWNGRNDNGLPVSSGVYIMHIEAGDPSAGSGQRFVDAKRIVLMK